MAIPQIKLAQPKPREAPAPGMKWISVPGTVVGIWSQGGSYIDAGSFDTVPPHGEGGLWDDSWEGLPATTGTPAWRTHWIQVPDQYSSFYQKAGKFLKPGEGYMTQGGVLVETYKDPATGGWQVGEHEKAATPAVESSSLAKTQALPALSRIEVKKGSPYYQGGLVTLPDGKVIQARDLSKRQERMLEEVSEIEGKTLELDDVSYQPRPSERPIKVQSLLKGPIIRPPTAPEPAPITRLKAEKAERNTRTAARRRTSSSTSKRSGNPSGIQGLR